jgi:hypothetical protein
MSETFPISKLCFTKVPDGRRKCNLCPTYYSASTGPDALRSHWHAQHHEEANDMRVPLSNRDREKPPVFASTSVSSSSSLFSGQISAPAAARAVVVKFCEKARVTQGFRWNEHREGLLHALIVEAGIDVHLLDMQARVKQYVASPLP